MSPLHIFINKIDHQQGMGIGIIPSFDLKNGKKTVILQMKYIYLCSTHGLAQKPIFFS
jgi:hypothetical protein